MNIKFSDRNFAHVSQFGGVVYNVNRFCWSNIGGPKTADITVTGDPLALLQFATRLRFGITISDSTAGDVWWGYLDAVDLYVDNYQLSVSLANMWNSIKVQYTSDVEVTTTAANTNARSVTLYGTKETVFSASDIDTSTAAQAMRDRLLDDFGLPRVTRLPSTQGAAVAQLTCAGWWNTLGWKYYANTGTSDTATTTQIGAIVTDAGQFLTGTKIVTASGINTLETRDGKQRANSEIEKLLTVGVSGGNRLNAKVNRARWLWVDAEPMQGVSDYQLHKGVLTDHNGAVIANSRCPVGIWVTTTGNIFGQYNVTTLFDPGRFFVEEAEYEVATNRWTPTPRGSYIPGVSL